MGITVGPAPRGALGGSDATADARAVLGPQSEFLQGIWLESVLFSLLLFDKHRQHIKSRDITLPTNIHTVKAMVFQWSCMGVRVGLQRRLSAKELLL